MSSHRLMPHSCLQLLWHQYIAVTAGPTAWQYYRQIPRQLCHRCRHIQPWYVQSDPSVVLLSGQYYSQRSWYFHLLEKGNQVRVVIMSGFPLARNEWGENTFLTHSWEYGLECVRGFEVTCIVLCSVCLLLSTIAWTAPCYSICTHNKLAHAPTCTILGLDFILAGLFWKLSCNSSGLRFSLLNVRLGKHPSSIEYERWLFKIKSHN